MAKSSLLLILALMSTGCAYHNPTAPTPAPVPPVVVPPPPVVVPPAIPPTPAPVNPFTLQLMSSFIDLNTVQFGLTASGSQSGLTVAWTFGDGVSATGLSARHVYAAGRYDVRVVGTLPDGRTAEDTTVIRVVAASGPAPPTQAPAPVPSSPVLLVAVFCSVSGHIVSCNMSALNESGSSIPSNTFTSVGWDFGDGNLVSGTASTIQHTYSQPGDFRVVVNAATPERRGLSSMSVVIP